MRILLLGRNGQVGRELSIALSSAGELVAYGRAELDLTDERAIRAAVRRVQPALIVNAAAYTAVDAAEQETALATAVNAEAPRIVAEEVAAVEARLIHYSTDYVFDGEKDIAYVESDVPNPLGAYGRSKLAGERAIEHTRAHALILRTSGVYSEAPGNFVSTIRRAARARPQLEVVTDQTGSPTWARTIARVTREIIDRWRRDDGKQAVYHFASRGAPSRHTLATKIVELANARGETALTPRDVKPIRTSDLATAGAPRPRFSALDSGKLERDFGIEMPAWDSDLARFFDETPPV